MKSEQIAARWRVWILALAIGIFLLPEGVALAIPKDPPPKPEIQASDSGELRVARRRRRRRRRRPRRRRRRPTRPAPRPAPKPAAATPDSDLSNNTSKGSSAAVDPGALRRGGRVEFDGRLVQGQTAKSGAIYLFARKRSELKSMVEERTNYRKEILRTVDTKWSKEAK
jgi:hypothetical protein